MCFELYLNFIEVILLVIVAAFSFKTYESAEVLFKVEYPAAFPEPCEALIAVRVGTFPSFL